MSNQILIDPPKIPLTRLVVLKGALKLEIVGMSRRGRSAYQIVKNELGLKGSKQRVLDQLIEHIEFLREGEK
jgi:hypothetical protein|tara:strand:+ start:5084 stop:5299 length:216 start_codon:yes stop_codon:yes gene_type:complete